MLEHLNETISREEHLMKQGKLPSTTKCDESLLKEEVIEFINLYKTNITITRKNKIPLFRILIKYTDKAKLSCIGSFLKHEIGIIPKIYKENDCFVLLYGGNEVAALNFYITRQFSENHKPKVCNECGEFFIKVAGLQNKCNKCHNKD